MIEPTPTEISNVDSRSALLPWPFAGLTRKELLVRLGLHISNFTWPSVHEPMAERLGAIASTADEVGFDRISVMDHVFQIRYVGPPENEMLEAYTTLGFLAAKTESVKLYALCTAVVYRSPGLLAKAVTTLDVLTGGRAMLGIGSAWNDEESEALGLSFPPRSERYEQLEEALQICLQMWSDSEEPFVGKHFRLGRTLNSPQSVTRPHPPILIGGSGEQRTMRLVAKYADACNFFFGENLVHKLDVLREHCDREGREYDEIEKTVLYPLSPGERGSEVGRIVDELGGLAELGFTVAIGSVEGVEHLTPLEIIGEQVIPAVESL
jgi:F420-dependent oxidoreductase-like protein